MILSRKAAAIVGGIAAAGIVGTAGIAAATAAPSPSDTPAPSAAASSPAPPDREKSGQRGDKHLRRGGMFRGLHGEWVVRGAQEGQYVTLVGVRGEVTAVSATSITVRAADGFTATFTVNGDTKVRGRQIDAIGEVKVGATAGVVGAKGSGGALTARVVRVRG